MAWVTVKLPPTEDINAKIECPSINIANMVRDALNAMEA